jgi:hypothetical protein
MLSVVVIWSAIQIARPFEAIAETQPAFLSLSAMISEYFNASDV